MDTKLSIQNLAKQNHSDVSIFANGECFISQRKASLLCGVALSTLQNFFRSSNIVISQGLTPENFSFSVTHYALKGRTEAIKTLTTFTEAGAKAYIYNLAGLKLGVTGSASQSISIPQTLPEALRAYADEVEQHEKTKLALEQTKTNLEQTKTNLEDSKVRLDESKEWVSIKRMAMLTGRDWKSFDWRMLKPLHPTKKIFDGNYGSVNVYHRDAWMKVYPETAIHFGSMIDDKRYSSNIYDWLSKGWTVDMLINQGYLLIH